MAKYSLDLYLLKLSLLQK